MNRLVPIARRYGLLVLGAAGIVVGLILLAQPAPSAFGWTAYAPLSTTTFVPSSFVTGFFVPGVTLLAVGLALVAGWTGFALGRRRRV